MKKLTQWIFFLFLVGWGGLPVSVAEENKLLSLNAGIDQLAFQLTDKIAAQYFDEEKRPVIRVAVFDFVDPAGNITVGSQYVSTRMRLAFAEGLQFELMPVLESENRGGVVTAKEFSKNIDLRDRLLGELKADAYLLGTVVVDENSKVSCKIDLWGISPPYDHWYAVEPFEVESRLPWRLGFSPSGSRFFAHVVREGAQGIMRDFNRENLGKVVFLTQPICDDLHLSWQIRADGMVYDIRKESNSGSLRNRSGQVLQSRVKSREMLKELSYIIKNFTLVIKEEGGEAFGLEPYVLPQKSDYFFLPFSDDETGLRFQYLWAKRGISKKPSSLETGKGWKFHAALEDYDSILAVGTHVATATLSPMAESQYGSKNVRDRTMLPVSNFSLNRV